MENPFIYGEAVAGKNFCDRAKEMKRLKSDLKDSQKVFLISPRRMGKTSLIMNVLHLLKKEKMITVFLDVGRFTSLRSFLEAYLSLLMREATAFDRMVRFVRETLPGFRVEVQLNEVGTPSLSLGYARSEPLPESVASQIFALPGIISKKKQKKLVVVFDEFQEIDKLDGDKVKKQVRSTIQHQRNVAYVFAGSSRHVLSAMASSPASPFYKIGPVVYLRKIPEELFFKFVQTKFTETGISISTEAISAAIKAAENTPYYIQMFAHELWSQAITGGKIEKKDVRKIIEQTISHNSEQFSEVWSRMKLSRRLVLGAIAISGGKSMLSGSYLSQHGLGSPPSVRKTLLSLINEGFLDKEENTYYFVDILFREWVKKQVK